MKCKIIKFIKTERKDLPPCFKIKAIGIRDEADMLMPIDEDDYKNPLSAEFLPPIFEKVLFPPTIRQAKQLEERCKTDQYGNIIGEPVFIRLMPYQWKTPFSYYIVNKRTVTGVCETIIKTREKEVKYDDHISFVEKIRYIPKIFSSITVTLFETPDGKCAENNGDADGVCETVFSNAIASGHFIRFASQIKEIVKHINGFESVSNSYDDWKDYYNWDYYNDGLDMDQQDERFWE